ncbi:MAG: hypothetical protein R3C09_03925 [Pirellulaceae bacterium]
MNPEDPMQFDSLASKLSLLQPASTDRLQALAFFEAGRRAASSRPAPSRLKLRSLAASLAVAILCSTASFYAGSQLSATRNSDASNLIAAIELTPPDSSPASASVVNQPSEHEPVEQRLASRREPARPSLYAQLATPMLVSWLQLPQRDAEDYLRHVEMRTRPPLSRTAATPEPASTAPSSLDRQLPELERLQIGSPLRRWLSM